MKNKKGISLIVLVITIIVMIILAAAIILSLNNAGIIGNANQAVFKQNVKNYLSELDLYYMDELVANSGVNTKEISATSTTIPSITDLIPSMSNEDKNKFRVADGKLIYLGANRNEYEWCRELGILIDSTNLSQEEYEALYAEEIAYAESIGGVSSEMVGGYIVKSGTELETDIIVLPWGTTVIGFGAFDSLPVKEVVIPNTVYSIEDWSFMNCKELTTVMMPDSVTYIGESFLDCTSLEFLKLSSLLRVIEGSFNGCTSLTTITIPKTVTSINDGTGPFSGCTNLKSINVEEGNTKFKSIDGALYNIEKAMLVAVPAGKTGQFIIPNTVQIIAMHCFENCDKITNIIIPNTVTKMRSCVFQGCSSLKNVVIPESVTNLETSNLFGGCTNLTSVKLPNTFTTMDSSMFYNCANLESIVIPEGVTTIVNGAFNGCSKLMKVYIEPTVLSTVGNKAFTTIAEGSTIYVRSAAIASALAGKYDTTKTTISTDYNW